jgi:FkbM family methyltransferase
VQPWWRKRNATDDYNLALLLRLSLPQDARCVDVGANVGSILDAIVEAAPAGKHIAFEPVPWLANDLRARFPGVEVHEAAVADKAGEATFVVIRDRPALSGLQATLSSTRTGGERETITVSTVRLDDVLIDGPAPSFIKIDVEGGELAVLQGAEAVLAEAKPLLAFEFGHGYQLPDDAQCEEVFAEIDRHGLRLFDMDGRRLPWLEFRGAYRSGSHWNFVAHR